jgi:hypothetical protein
MPLSIFFVVVVIFAYIIHYYVVVISNLLTIILITLKNDTKHDKKINSPIMRRNKMLIHPIYHINKIRFKDEISKRKGNTFSFLFPE